MEVKSKLCVKCKKPLSSEKTLYCNDKCKRKYRKQVRNARRAVLKAEREQNKKNYFNSTQVPESFKEEENKRITENRVRRAMERRDPEEK